MQISLQKIRLFSLRKKVWVNLVQQSLQTETKLSVKKAPIQAGSYSADRNLLGTLEISITTCRSKTLAWYFYTRTFVYLILASILRDNGELNGLHHCRHFSSVYFDSIM